VTDGVAVADPLDRPTVAAAAGVEWFDSHSHLQDEYLPAAPGRTAPPDPSPAAGAGAGVAGVLGRSVEAGVRRTVCIGTDAATSDEALSLAIDVRRGRFGAAVPEVWATIGLHPHEASSGTAEVEALLAAAVERGDGVLVGVGECGLDYHYEHSPRADQRRAFATQVGLAQRYGLTLVVHARDAWDDLFAVLATEGVPERAVLHCFTGGVNEAARCVELGMYVSFSGIVTFKNAGDVRAAAAACPPERLLVETDSPFLAPVPHRGRTNEPALVPLVGAAVAAATGRSLAEVAAMSTAAARAAFDV
jgi:TatD DNase family protein